MKSFLLRVFVCLLFSFQTCFAANRTYPVSEVNFGAYNTTYNLNVSGLGAGSPLNIYAPTGNENEDWRINYISDGVFEIENSTTGTFITAGTNNVAQIAAQVNNTTQRWQIVGVTKDFLGAFLYYKIINVGNGKALTYSGTTVVLADYIGGNNQLWRLDLDGLEGFGALCKVNEGTKASTIGGLLGQTVFVSTLADLRAALGNVKPLTIVLTANLDCVKEGSDMRIDNYKTLIGSFATNTLTDARLTTNYYGWANPPANPGPPSDNIVVKNLTFPVIGREDVIVFQFYSGKNLWVDHCTFYSTLKKAADEVGKFIWINTPSAGPDITRNPDFITLSYNILRNRYWCVAYGTQNTTTSEDRTTVAFNIWDSNVRRTPQIGNGSMHTYNNFNVNNSSSVENAGYANVIPGDGSFVYAEANRFENFKKESSGYWDEEYVVGSTPFKDNGSYTNRSESGSSSVVPYLWSTTKTLPTLSWNPRTNYGYKVLKAYNSSAATDAKAFNQKYSGCQNTMSNFKYITDTDMSAFVSETVKNPFLITTLGVPDCAGVLNGTAVLDNCSRCVGGTTGKTACSSVGEAETDACTFDGIVETKNAGFKGASYLNVDNAVGTSITFNITAANAGIAMISFRYANGGTVDRPAQISLNGTVLPNNLSFPVTGTFADWKSVDLILTLLKGNNTMKINSYRSEGLPNIDQIGYVSAGVTKGSCVITGSTNYELETTNYEVYPNPSKTSFHVNVSKAVDFQVIDINGKLCEEYKNVSNTEFGENLKSGIYFLKIENKMYKLVKE